MDAFISRMKGQGKRCSHFIAEIGRETKNENFEHLIIVSDGCVSASEIDESDTKVYKYGLQYSYVSNYIISGGDESVGCPYYRGGPGVICLIDNYGNEKQQVILSREDQNALELINLISNWSSFKSKYKNLFNAIRAKCFGKTSDPGLKDDLNNLRARIHDAGSEQNDFDKKYNELYKMADGQIVNVTNTATAA